MASSVARIPMDHHHHNWADRERDATAGAGSHVDAACRRNLPRLFLPRPSPPCSDSDDLASAAAASVAVPDQSSSFSSCSSFESIRTESPNSKRRQSQILDRWAARQAREMISTIERQAHEAELSALSASVEPVSARAATFLRETSPPLSGGSSVAGDLPQSVRASELIQMWRELEADSGFTPTHRGSGDGNSGAMNAAFSSAEEPSGGSETCDESEGESELTGRSEPQSSVAESSDVESFRGMGSGSTVRGSMRSWSNDIEVAKDEFFSKQENNVNYWKTNGPRPLLRGRRGFEKFPARIEQERQSELAWLAERGPVSKFSHRIRIQSHFRFLILRREVAVQDQHRPTSTAVEIDNIPSSTNILFLRERFNGRFRQDGSAVTEIRASSHLHLPDNTPDPVDPVDPVVADQRANAATEHQEDHLASVVSEHWESGDERDSESTSSDQTPLVTRNDKMQAESQSSYNAWQVRSVDNSNLDWQRPLVSLNLHNWQGEVVTDDPQFDAQPDVREYDNTWLNYSSQPERGWESHRQAIYPELLENYSDNVEIRDLLERKRVSSSLASDFREKMDRLMLSHLQRQQSFNESTEEEEGEENFQRQNHESSDSDQVASSSSLMPLQYRTYHRPGIPRCSSFSCHQSNNILEIDLIHDLKSDMAQIHREVGELRKLVEFCMDRQAKLDHSVSKEAPSAVDHSDVTETALHGSNWLSTRKGNCCICYETRIDSLLYRCGHMCTCFKCALELQWGSRRCPICRAPIADVVRAYSDS